MQIRCNFPDISYLRETQKNNFQFFNNSILTHMYNIFFHQTIMLWKPGTGPHFIITANSL